MNITANHPMGGQTTHHVEDFITQALQSTCDGGLAEGAQQVADKAAKAVGTLCNILATKGLLTAEEIVQIADAYVINPKLTD